jgi:tetratricopeptide (TPR) repeat protein
MRQICEALVAERPADREARYWLGISYENLSFLRWAEGDRAGATDLKRRQLEIFLGISRAEPTNTQVRRDLAVVYHNLGWSLQAQGDWEGALSNYRQALALKQELAAADPANQGVRRDIANTHWGIGDALRGKKDLRGAADSYRRAATMLEELLAGDAQGAATRQWLAGTLDSLAATLAGLGGTEEARRHARRSLALYKAEAEKAEATPDDVNRYAWQLLTVVPPDLRDPRTALTWAGKGVEMTRGENPDMLDTLALAHHLSGDREAAIATGQRALDLLPPGAPRRRDFEASLARFKAGRRDR